MDLFFKLIDLDKHFGFCYEFRRDSYVCSFGIEAGYDKSVVGYQAKIHERLNDPNWYYLHIWYYERIIGQLEFKSFSFLKDTGYVHLIYIVPEFRGSGVAGKAESFIAATLKKQHCHSAELSVSRINERAIRHYSRFGWMYLKPNSKHRLTDFYIRQL